MSDVPDMTKKKNIFDRLTHMKRNWAIVIFILLDLFCTGLGMGVPFFTILMGLPVGWWLAQRLTQKPQTLHSLLGNLLRYAALTAAFSVLILSVIWLPSLKMLFDPSADLANYGIPFILYEPLASYIGWLVLMVLISPFLQFLMTLFGAVVTLWAGKRDLSVNLRNSESGN